MAKHVDGRSELSIKDLISGDGITFEIGNDYLDLNDDDDDELPYSSYVQYSDKEMLDMLNIDNFEDTEQPNNDEKEELSLYSMSFEKLKSKMTNLIPDGKVMKYVKQKGIGDLVPKNAQVTVHYIGYFEYSDEPFDSSYCTGKPRVLNLNEGNVIPGLQIGIESMQKHEKAVFLIHPDLAYKSVGCPPRIPGNEEVVFIVHLFDYLDNSQASKDLSVQDKKQFEIVAENVRHKLVNAKNNVAKFNVKAAVREYRKVIGYLEDAQLKDDKEEKEMNELLSRAYTNLGICYNKLEMPRAACIACQRVPTPTAKSYYKTALNRDHSLRCCSFGKALLTLAEYDEAMRLLQKAHKMDSSSDAIKKLIQQTNTKQRKYLEIEKRLWKNCLKSNEEQVEVSEFRKAVRDLCQTIIQGDDVVRQPLPEGLTEEEHEIVREEAAMLGLNILTCSRYGKDTVYVEKPKA